MLIQLLFASNHLKPTAKNTSRQAANGKNKNTTKLTGEKTSISHF